MRHAGSHRFRLEINSADGQKSKLKRLPNHGWSNREIRGAQLARLNEAAYVTQWSFKLHAGGRATKVRCIGKPFGYPLSRALTARFLYPVSGCGRTYRGREDMANVQGASLKVMLPSSTV